MRRQRRRRRRQEEEEGGRLHHYPCNVTEQRGRERAGVSARSLACVRVGLTDRSARVYDSFNGRAQI